jgi:hypothetical protein
LFPGFSGPTVTHQHVAETSTPKNVVRIKDIMHPFQAGETGGGKCDLELIVLELLAQRKHAV